jgi:GTPase
LISAGLARALCEAVRATRRRVGLLLDRHGRVDKVIVGDANRIYLPELGARRAGAKRFRGVRLILGSLRPDGLNEDDLTDLSLLQLDAVCTIHALETGLSGAIQYAHLLPPDSSAKPWKVEKLPSIHDWNLNWTEVIADLEAQFARSAHLLNVESSESVILVGITLDNPKRAKRSMVELQRLAGTAGLHVVDSVLQNRRKLDGRTCIGQGKLQELIVRSMHLGAEALIFDRELSPSQLRNIAQATDLKVLDRTQLILDIFAQHARSREGKLQVELAQLRYRMPRLAIMPTSMSRLTGGIGGRGPGETKLEINRRRAQERLTSLERALKKLSKNRALRRKRRRQNRVPVCALVGYTNAGKSTLLNRLTRSDVLVEDKLFATLDPTSRRFRFPEEREILITDTVGFIEDLPKTLVKAFKATLEELEEADLLLHVVDASDPDVDHYIRAVETILGELNLSEHHVLLVWNKADLADQASLEKRLNAIGGHALSALTGEGTQALLKIVEQSLFRSAIETRWGSDQEPLN